MAYVIAEPCIDVMDRACVEECPVDCIYEADVPGRWVEYVDDNVAFFHDRLPGAETPIGSPGGAAKLGPTGVDTVLVAGHPHPDGAGSV